MKTDDPFSVTLLAPCKASSMLIVQALHGACQARRNKIRPRNVNSFRSLTLPARAIYTRRGAFWDGKKYEKSIAYFPVPVI
ncbi:MAG TPA: hypothetical protein VN512_01870 [Clostridia bacterium]|nr:hypothetical protein [Clostridia bacterium]